MNYVSALLKSKRTWVIAVTLAFHFAARYHIVFSNANVDDIADQCVQVVGGVGVVVTKILDSRQANLPPAQPRQL